MEAKDTVIPGHYSPEEFTRLQHQAEISFKAGYDKGHTEARNHCEDVLLPQEKQAGIQLVVEPWCK